MKKSTTKMGIILGAASLKMLINRKSMIKSRGRCVKNAINDKIQ